MSDITVKMKDGEVREFKEQGRPGGSWRNRVSTEGPFLVITDEWEKRTMIPAADIADVEVSAPRSW